jgi:hypothetical protein
MGMIVDFAGAKQRAKEKRVVDGSDVLGRAIGKALGAIDQNMTRHEAAAYVELYANALLAYAHALRDGPDGMMGHEEPGDGDA